MQHTNCIGIYQNSGSNFSEILTSALRKCGHDISPKLLHSTGYSAALPNTLDVCILESGYRKSDSFPYAHTAIVPDICSMSTITQIKPKSVITYGLSCKNTVTVSSLVDTRMIISIQREILSTGGIRTGEQEFAVNLSNINLIEAALASTALLLLLDTPVDTIKENSKSIF